MPTRLIGKIATRRQGIRWRSKQQWAVGGLLRNAPR
jgi:hypothetical protein